jgi:SAM-dependent methyltransferase
MVTMTDEDNEYSARIIGWLEQSYAEADERGDIFGGSGSSGDMAHWETRRRVIASAFDRDGTWLDVGCANGLLMTTLPKWVAEKGFAIEAHGLELSAKVAERARIRYPQFADRIWTGNVMFFEPPIRFDFVTAISDSVAPHRCAAMVERIAALYLNRGGRVILSCYGPGGFITATKASADDPRRFIVEAGMRVAGYAEHRDEANNLTKVRVAWADVN